MTGWSPGRYVSALTAGVVALCLGGVGVAAGAPLAGAAAAVTPAGPRVQLQVLVLDDGEPMVRGIVAQLDREGVPYSTVNLESAARPKLTQAFLQGSDAGGVFARYQGVVAPNSSPAALSADELTALRAFERSFGIRQVSAYNWPSAQIGMGAPVYSGAVDAMTGTVTPAAKSAGFGYLKGAFAFDDFAPGVVESWGYVANALSPMPAGTSFTPFVTVSNPEASGTVVGVATDNGFEDMVLTFAMNEYQQTHSVLAHGIVQWLTRGVHLGEYHNYFSLHIDDVFLADDLWSIEGHCTIGDGCDPVKYPDLGGSRMTAADATFVKTWQAANGIKLDLTFNGGGSDEWATSHANKDVLLDAFKANGFSSYRWLNHTFTHEFLSCVKIEGRYPEACYQQLNGTPVWVPQPTIHDQIRKNVSWASAKRIPITASELVTGEHGGLKGPLSTSDNPWFGGTLTLNGITFVGSDASRESAQRGVGTALTVPRYPMNIYYNVETAAQETAEYNWIYGSRADGGSGLCDDNPATTTCIKPLDLTTGFRDVIVPAEARLALRHATTNDPRPHYAHQANLAGERIVYPVLDAMLTQYRAIFDAATTPIVNPTTTEAGNALRIQTAWKAAQPNVTAMLDGTRVTITNPTTTAVTVPITAGPNSTALVEKYAGAREDRKSVKAKGSTTLTLAAADVTYPKYTPAAGPAAGALGDAVAPLWMAFNRATTEVPAREVPAAALPVE